MLISKKRLENIEKRIADLELHDERKTCMIQGLIRKTSALKKERGGSKGYLIQKRGENGDWETVAQVKREDCALEIISSLRLNSGGVFRLREEGR